MGKAEVGVGRKQGTVAPQASLQTLYDLVGVAEGEDLDAVALDAACSIRLLDPGLSGGERVAAELARQSLSEPEFAGRYKQGQEELRPLRAPVPSAEHLRMWLMRQSRVLKAGDARPGQLLVPDTRPPGWVRLAGGVLWLLQLVGAVAAAAALAWFVSLAHHSGALATSAEAHRLGGLTGQLADPGQTGIGVALLFALPVIFFVFWLCVARSDFSPRKRLLPPVVAAVTASVLLGLVPLLAVGVLAVAAGLCTWVWQRSLLPDSSGLAGRVVRLRAAAGDQVRRRRGLARWDPAALALPRVAQTNSWLVPGVTRWFASLDTVAEAATGLIVRAAQSGVEVRPAAEVDLVAAVIAADVWSEAYAVPMEKVMYAGVGGLRWLAFALARAGGHGQAVDATLDRDGYEVITAELGDPTSGPQYQQWAVRMLGAPGAAQALSLAAADIEAGCAGTREAQEAARIVAALRYRANMLREAGRAATTAQAPVAAPELAAS